MNILFMGGHELGKITLEYLIRMGKHIVGVVITDTDDIWYKGVDEIAYKYGLPLFREKNINDKGFVNKIRAISPDLIVVVNFDQILKEELISIPPKGCINTHASLLPKYRGRAPLNWAIIRGEQETGVTVHFINKGIDTGEIVIQKKISIGEDDYIEDIMGKVKEMYPIIVNEAVDKIESNLVTPIKQEISNGFYCTKRTPKDGQINWDRPTAEIYNLIRAISRPYPGAYTYYNNHKVIIWRAEKIIAEDRSVIKEISKVENGYIYSVDDNRILVKTSDGFINIKSYEFCATESCNVKIEPGKYFYNKED